MWLGQVKFFCIQCGADVTDDISRMIERRCRDLSIDPTQLAEKAGEASKAELLRELGEEPENPVELAFIKATALMLMEFAYSPTLLCNKCRSPEQGEDLSHGVRLRLIKGGKEEK